MRIILNTMNKTILGALVAIAIIASTSTVYAIEEESFDDICTRFLGNDKTGFREIICNEIPLIQTNIDTLETRTTSLENDIISNNLNTDSIHTDLNERVTTFENIKWGNMRVDINERSSKHDSAAIPAKGYGKVHVSCPLGTFLIGYDLASINPLITISHLMIHQHDIIVEFYNDGMTSDTVVLDGMCGHYVLTPP